MLSKNLKMKIYRTVILPLVLCGCEIWSLILREERRLRVCENRVLRRIFGTRRNEVTGEWRNYVMRNLMICTLHPIFLGDKIEKNELGGQVARTGERRIVYRVLVGKPEGKRRLGRPRRRWEDNIRMDLQEEGCGDMDWIELAQDRNRWPALVYAVMSLS